MTATQSTYNFVVKPTVYIETTVPSYYCDDRPGVVRRYCTNPAMMGHGCGDYECYISEAVLAELGEGNYPTPRHCLSLASEMPELAITEEIEQIAIVYQAQVDAA